jgi:type I restriction enzyme S subunit
MNTDVLLAYYERIAEAPDAIARLRRFVLDLAVRGRLVPQDLAETSSLQALGEAQQRIKAAAERASRLRWHASKPVEPNNEPRDLPRGWVAARINDTGLYINGLAFKPSDWKPRGLPIIRIQNLTDPSKEFNFAEGSFPAEVIVEPGDILVSWSATLDAFKWNRGRGILNQHIFRVIRDEGLTHPDFLLMLLQHAIRTMADGDHARGLVMTHINRGPFLNYVIGIPPLAEQRRIAAKVAELMALCDQLEAARAAREATRDRLTAASLARLNTPDPETFPADARFALDALPALTTRPDQIKQLRQTILNLAVRGKLVPQDPSTEPASGLMKRIREWQRQAILQKKIRAPRKPLTAIKHEECPYRCPTGWSFVRLGEIIYIQSGDGLTAANMKDGPVPVFGGNGISGYHNQSNVDRPTIVIGRVGYYCGSVHVTPPRAWVTDNAFITHFSHNEICSRFLVLLLNGTNLKEDENATAQPVISGSKIYPIVVGLPPLAEQHRIVAKVDELMALCDAIEASLTTATTVRTCLLEATLRETLQPAETPALEAAE